MCLQNLTIFQQASDRQQKHSYAVIILCYLQAERSVTWQRWHRGLSHHTWPCGWCWYVAIPGGGGIPPGWQTQSESDLDGRFLGRNHGSHSSSPEKSDSNGYIHFTASWDSFQQWDSKSHTLPPPLSLLLSITPPTLKNDSFLLSVSQINCLWNWQCFGGSCSLTPRAVQPEVEQ